LSIKNGKKILFLLKRLKLNACKRSEFLMLLSQMAFHCIGLFEVYRILRLKTLHALRVLPSHVLRDSALQSVHLRHPARWQKCTRNFKHSGTYLVNNTPVSRAVICVVYLSPICRVHCNIHKGANRAGQICVPSDHLATMVDECLSETPENNSCTDYVNSTDTNGLYTIANSNGFYGWRPF